MSESREEKESALTLAEMAKLSNDQFLSSKPLLGNKNKRFQTIMRFAAKRESEREKRDRLRTERLDSDIKLSRRVANWSLILVTILLAFTILFILWYLWFVFYRQPDKFDPAILITWMTSTVVEVIGIVYVIARYLFPTAALLKEDEAETVQKDEDADAEEE